MNVTLPNSYGRLLLDAQGKGAAGCILSLVLLGVAIFAIVRVGPDYYAFKSFETDVRTEISRAGANFYEDETLLKNILALAKRNEISVKKENIKIERFPGQIQVTIHHIIQLDFLVYMHNLPVEFKASSFIGRL